MSDGQSLYGLALRSLAPLAFILSIWVWMGTSMHTALDILFVTFIMSFVLTIGWASMCSWWFCLSRRAAVNVPLALSALLGIGVLIATIVFDGGWESLQLNSAVAIMLRSTLQILTLAASLSFILALVLSDVGHDAEEE